MTEPRPRSFLWVRQIYGRPMPSIVFNDPRCGFDGLRIIEGSEIKLDPDDTRTLSQLAADHPAPMESI